MALQDINQIIQAGVQNIMPPSAEESFNEWRIRKAEEDQKAFDDRLPQQPEPQGPTGRNPRFEDKSGYLTLPDAHTGKREIMAEGAANAYQGLYDDAQRRGSSARYSLHSGVRDGMARTKQAEATIGTPVADNVGWLHDLSGYTGAPRVKPLAQSNDVSCGQTSVAMCINSVTGKSLTDTDINAKYGFGLLNALNAESADAGVTWRDGGNLGPKQWGTIAKKVNKEGLPVMVGLNGPEFSKTGRGHIVTIVGVEGDTVSYADPATGEIKTTTKQRMNEAEAHPDGNFVFYGEEGSRGKTRSRQAHELFDQSRGTLIEDENDLLPGDLVGFRFESGGTSEGTPSHAGVYLGNGRVAHSPTPGGAVQETTIEALGGMVSGLRPNRKGLAGVEYESNTILAEGMDAQDLREATARGFHVSPDNPDLLVYGSARISPEEPPEPSNSINDYEPTKKAALDQAHRNNISPGVFANLILAESGWIPDAVSSVGAFGLTQLMPATAMGQAAKLGLDVTVDQIRQSPDLQLEIGASYLGDMLKRYGNYPQAIAAYNAGPGTIDAVLAGSETIPAETRKYVSKVLSIPEKMVTGLIKNFSGELYQAKMMAKREPDADYKSPYSTEEEEWDIDDEDYPGPRYGREWRKKDLEKAKEDFIRKEVGDFSTNMGRWKYLDWLTSQAGTSDTKLSGLNPDAQRQKEAEDTFLQTVGKAFSTGFWSSMKGDGGSVGLLESMASPATAGSVAGGVDQVLSGASRVAQAGIAPIQMVAEELAFGDHTSFARQMAGEGIATGTIGTHPVKNLSNLVFDVFGVDPQTKEDFEAGHRAARTIVKKADFTRLTSLASALLEVPGFENGVFTEEEREYDRQMAQEFLKQGGFLGPSAKKYLGIDTSHKGTEGLSGIAWAHAKGLELEYALLSDAAGMWSGAAAIQRMGASAVGGRLAAAAEKGWIGAPTMQKLAMWAAGTKAATPAAVSAANAASRRSVASAIASSAAFAAGRTEFVLGGVGGISAFNETLAMELNKEGVTPGQALWKALGVGAASAGIGMALGLGMRGAGTIAGTATKKSLEALDSGEYAKKAGKAINEYLDSTAQGRFLKETWEGNISGPMRDMWETFSTRYVENTLHHAERAALRGQAASRARHYQGIAHNRRQRVQEHEIVKAQAEAQLKPLQVEQAKRDQAIEAYRSAPGAPLHLIDNLVQVTSDARDARHAYQASLARRGMVANNPEAAEALEKQIAKEYTAYVEADKKAVDDMAKVEEWLSASGLPPLKDSQGKTTSMLGALLEQRKGAKAIAEHPAQKVLEGIPFLKKLSKMHEKVAQEAEFMARRFQEQSEGKRPLNYRPYDDTAMHLTSTDPVEQEAYRGVYETLGGRMPDLDDFDAELNLQQREQLNKTFHDPDGALGFQTNQEIELRLQDLDSHLEITPSRLVDFQTNLGRLWESLTPKQQKKHKDDFMALETRVGMEIGERQRATAAKERVLGPEKSPTDPSDEALLNNLKGLLTGQDGMADASLRGIMAVDGGFFDLSIDGPVPIRRRREEAMGTTFDRVSREVAMEMASQPTPAPGMMPQGANQIENFGQGARLFRDQAPGTREAIIAEKSLAQQGRGLGPGERDYAGVLADNPDKLADDAIDIIPLIDQQLHDEAGFLESFKDEIMENTALFKGLRTGLRSLSRGMLEGENLKNFVRRVWDDTTHSMSTNTSGINLIAATAKELTSSARGFHTVASMTGMYARSRLAPAVGQLTKKFPDKWGSNADEGMQKLADMMVGDPQQFRKELAENSELAEAFLPVLKVNAYLDQHQMMAKGTKEVADTIYFQDYLPRVRQAIESDKTPFKRDDVIRYLEGAGIVKTGRNGGIRMTLKDPSRLSSMAEQANNQIGSYSWQRFLELPESRQREVIGKSLFESRAADTDTVPASFGDLVTDDKYAEVVTGLLVGDRLSSPADILQSRVFSIGRADTQRKFLMHGSELSDEHGRPLTWLRGKEGHSKEPPAGYKSLKDTDTIVTRDYDIDGTLYKKSDIYVNPEMAQHLTSFYAKDMSSLQKAIMPLIRLKNGLALGGSHMPFLQTIGQNVWQMFGFNSADTATAINLRNSLTGEFDYHKVVAMAQRSGLEFQSFERNTLMMSRAWKEQNRPLYDQMRAQLRESPEAMSWARKQMLQAKHFGQETAHTAGESTIKAAGQATGRVLKGTGDALVAADEWLMDRLLFNHLREMQLGAWMFKRRQFRDKIASSHGAKLSPKEIDQLAGREAADFVNTFTGSVGEGLVHKNVGAAARTFMQAPQWYTAAWRAGMGAVTKQTFRHLPAQSRERLRWEHRKHLGVQTVLGLAGLGALQYMLTGTTPDENPPGRQFQARVSEERYLSLPQFATVNKVSKNFGLQSLGRDLALSLRKAAGNEIPPEEILPSGPGGFASSALGEAALSTTRAMGVGNVVEDLARGINPDDTSGTLKKLAIGASGASGMYQLVSNTNPFTGAKREPWEFWTNLTGIGTSHARLTGAPRQALRALESNKTTELRLEVDTNLRKAYQAHLGKDWEAESKYLRAAQEQWDEGVDIDREAAKLLMGSGKIKDGRFIGTREQFYNFKDSIYQESSYQIERAAKHQKPILRAGANRRSERQQGAEDKRKEMFDNTTGISRLFR